MPAICHLNFNKAHLVHIRVPHLLPSTHNGNKRRFCQRCVKNDYFITISETIITSPKKQRAEDKIISEKKKKEKNTEWQNASQKSWRNSQV